MKRRERDAEERSPEREQPQSSAQPPPDQFGARNRPPNPRDARPAPGTRQFDTQPERPAPGPQQPDARTQQFDARTGGAAPGAGQFDARNQRPDPRTQQFDPHTPFVARNEPSGPGAGRPASGAGGAEARGEQGGGASKPFNSGGEAFGGMPEQFDARVGGPGPRRDRSRDFQPRRTRARRPERSRSEPRRPERRTSRMRQPGAQARHGIPSRPGPRAKPRGGRGPSDRLGIGAIVLSTAVGLSLLGIAERALLEGGPIGGSSGPIGSQRAITPPDRGGVPGQSPQQSPQPGQSGGPASPDGPDLRTLAAQVRRLTLAQRGAAARRVYGAAPSRAPVVGATRTSPDKTWVFGTTAIPVPESSAANPEVAFYAARWTGREWQVGLSGGRLFNDLLGAVPTDVMPAAEATALRRYAAVTEERAASLVNGTRAGDKLMLPWKVGEAWAMATADGSARPLASLAFSGGDGRVLASGDGRLYRFCADSAGRAMIMVIHPSGVATTYYRVRGVPAKVRDGAVVEQGDPLGRTGADRPCGGAAAPRAEVAFGVRRGGGTVPLEGARIGGWTFRERAEPLVGFAERGVLQVLPGGLLANLGPVPPADDAPPGAPLPDVPPLDGSGPVAAPAPAAIQKRSPIGANSQQ
ncbi:hypothetical protein ACH35V_09320 [Actinomadura sp. 1N219]|uniref:hypothetical protein n=1 Tax=Actinomadura sp. 1N219 TaxID=3375152 RepID=UPI0037AD0216